MYKRLQYKRNKSCSSSSSSNICIMMIEFVLSQLSSVVDTYVHTYTFSEIY